MKQDRRHHGATHVHPPRQAAKFAEDSCDSHGFEQHVREPTHEENTLDLFMFDFDGNVDARLRDFLGKSIHDIVVSDFTVHLHKEGPVVRKV